MSGAADARMRGALGESPTPTRRTGTTRWCVASVALVCVLALAACSSSSSTTSSKRPTTNATLQILKPTPAEVVTGSSATIQFKLIGARVVPASVTALRGDEGHIHVSIDGKLVSMAYGTTQTLHDLTPGTHTLTAEFVATDHIPFANGNRVTEAVAFTVAK
jgi:hypothetical protein